MTTHECATHAWITPLCYGAAQMQRPWPDPAGQKPLPMGVAGTWEGAAPAASKGVEGTRVVHGGIAAGVDRDSTGAHANQVLGSSSSSSRTQEQLLAPKCKQVGLLNTRVAIHMMCTQ